MKSLPLILASAALALGGSAALARHAPDGEAKLAKMLEGRVAGKPVRCISTYRSQDIQVIDRVGLVYDAGRTIYVARAAHPESLRDSDVLIVERFNGASLCREDVRRTVDRTDGFMRSVVFLEDFVPYTKQG
jgi:hypothetical protein